MAVATLNSYTINFIWKNDMKIKLFLLIAFVLIISACNRQPSQTTFPYKCMRVYILAEKQKYLTFVDTMFSFQLHDTICVTKTLYNDEIADNRAWRFSQDKPHDMDYRNSGDLIQVRRAVVDSIYPKVFIRSDNE